MSALVAALPMYDWPENRAVVDAQWAALRIEMRKRGIDAPETLTRDTGDLLDFWRRADLLFAQTCWGPLELGLRDHVHVLGQPSYDGIEGGKSALYSSAIVMRRTDAENDADCNAPRDEAAVLPPLDALAGLRLAYNVPDSMSGLMGLERDLVAVGAGLELFASRLETGGHRASMRAVAGGLADLAAIDCASWALARRYEDASRDLVVVGWTAKRKGLPFITARSSSEELVAALKDVLSTINQSAG